MGDWDPLLEELERRRAQAFAMGGLERLERRNAEGRLDARARVEALVDPGSFREFGALVGGVARSGQASVPADALVSGMGEIEGRPVLVGAEDFTVLGGSIGLGTHAKRMRLAHLALQERVPLVMLLEGAGERATNALERYPYAPNDLQVLADLAGLVPTVSVVMGASAGHGALTALLADFVVMVEGGAIFSAGPPLVANATGEHVTKEELGGVNVHVAVSGVAHNSAPDDRAALVLVRRYLGYFGSNAWERPPRAMGGAAVDAGPRRLDGILELVPANPRRPYDMRRVVDLICDAESMLEVQPRFGDSLLTCLARIGGEAVAVFANQPMVRAGAIDADAADKASRFLEIADAFHLPVVLLADNPGVMAGKAAERAGALRSAARMFAAQARIRAPKLHVTLRKAYGFGSSVMGMNPFDGQTMTLAFPSASLGAMPAAGASTASGAGTEMRRELETREFGGPWSAADTMSYDEVIDPRDLRNSLLDALRLARVRASLPPVPRPGGIRP